MNQMGGRKAKQFGEFFENLISASCNQYRNSGVAYIQKTPEPMKPVSAINRKRGKFQAVFTKKAQPDFAGTIQGGQSVVFEAKHCEGPRIEFKRLSDQQENDLIAHHKLGAIAFVIISFKAQDFYRIMITDWINLKESIGKLSLNQEDLEPYRIKNQGVFIPFLDGVLDKEKSYD